MFCFLLKKDMICFQPLKGVFEDSLVNTELNEDLKQNVKSIKKIISVKMVK
jgi:hypothetical protein